MSTMQISLKRLLAKKEIAAILQQLITGLAGQGQSALPFAISDAEGTVLMGITGDYSHHYGITVEGQCFGWVMGSQEMSAIASLLSYLAAKELEKKQLAQETLDRYKEVTLLYNLSEKMTANLQLQAVAQLVLAEASKLIVGNSGAVIFFDPETSEAMQLARFGTTFCLQPEQGIIGTIFATGNGEIVNQVAEDPRRIAAEQAFYSLVCAPLKSHNRTIGVIIIASSDLPINYTAADLKRLNAVASQAAAAIENALLHENKLREERIKSNLERYVPARLVQAILQSNGEISLAPVRKEISVLFSDIRNFTSQCEELEPEMVVGYLNEYFTHMVDVIFHHQGTVNKFVGDMIVALFGAPSLVADNQACAIESAIAMQRRIQTIPIPWIRENFRTGIGISSGKVIVGNIGSPQHMDYTAIGDEVNTASRLQSLAQGGQILVTRSVYEATCDRFQFKNSGSINVKGKKNAIEVFEVIY
ncbi:adenylate/guanylate cyclase domain-containing protein [Pantanalinema rosaneae CENA516]|uniref:adenylate/guanylate cyclase domain-containing protein n=1 Tax=Pantanalinema rosaneae TaxID=1620701 RepID=UPI003D6DF9BE